MITGKSTLGEICFEVADALNAYGILAVLAGGSAAAIYAPKTYSSHDADFVLNNDDPLDDVAAALKSTGFARDGRSRIFSHPDSPYTVDFPKGPLGVGSDYVTEVSVLVRGSQQLRIVTPTDCVRDRLAHFYFWDDDTALNAAVGVAAGHDVDLDVVRNWTVREDPALLAKFEEFERRLRAVQRA